MKAVRHLAYLSAAPMVSTRPNAVLGGPQSHVLGVIAAFEKLGWVVHRYIVGDKLKAGWEQRDNAQVLRSSWFRLLLTDLIRILLGAFNGWQVARHLKDVDWAYERFASFQALGRWLQRLHVPWILETNGLMYVEASRDRRSMALTFLARSLEKRAYRDCDVLLCGTQALKDTLVGEAALDPGKVLVMPNAVDIEIFDPARCAPVRLFDGPTIGHMGSLVSWQGLDILIRAVSDLRRENIHYELALVGEGTQRAEWQQLTTSLGLGEHVKFTGQVLRPEVPAYIAGFDLGYSGQVVLRSGSMYHSPLKLYEYMAMGRPIIASAYEDARTLVHDEDIGYLYAPGDVEDLKRVLRRAYEQRARWPEMGSKARYKAMAQHSWPARLEAAIPKIETILEEKYGAAYASRR